MCSLRMSKLPKGTSDWISFRIMNYNAKNKYIFFTPVFHLFRSTAFGSRYVAYIAFLAKTTQFIIFFFHYLLAFHSRTFPVCNPGVDTLLHVFIKVFLFLQLVGRKSRSLPNINLFISQSCLACRGLSLCSITNCT